MVRVFDLNDSMWGRIPEREKRNYARNQVCWAEIGYETRLSNEIVVEIFFLFHDPFRPMF